MSGIEEIKQRALALDAPGLESALRAVQTDEDARSAARAWVLRDRRFFREVQETEHLRDGGWLGTTPWMRLMCLIALCPPVEAARAMQWGGIWDHSHPAARDRAAALLVEQPRAWAREFLSTAAQARFSASEARHAGGAFDRFVELGLSAHDLPCPPEGRTFVEHHLLGDWRHPVDAEQVRHDRIGADVVYLKIRFGLAAQLAPLVETMPTLVQDGTLDRARLVELCLESLTVETRPTSERIVAKILIALGLRPSEVPGGLAYLANVIATRDGSVGASLLPLALDLVEEADGLSELTRVVAGRPERKPKQLLLRALEAPGLLERVGRHGVLAALDILSIGLDDASLLSGLEKLGAQLGQAASAEPTPGPTGLWDLVLDPGPAREWPEWMVHHSIYWGRSYDWPDYLDRLVDADARAFEFTADQFLRHLAAHGSDRFVDRCHRLMLDGRLGLNRVVRLVEPAFLAGGLSLLWPSVLGVADEVASSATPMAGMPELLRLLTRYAADVPDGWALPPALAALADSREGTKSRMEAEALRSALTHAAAKPATDDPLRLTPSPLRGLWDLRTPVPALPRALHREGYPDLSPFHFRGLRTTASGELDRGSPSHRRRTSLQLMWSDERLIRSLGLAVQVHGLEPVRRLFADTAPTPPADSSPVGEALALWACGELTSDTYWAVLEDDRADVRPALDRVVFAWACEQLVRLPSHPGLLSSPGRADGTVAPARLADRVCALAGLGQVGPLDFLLAMTRLTASTDDTEALDRLVDSELWTDPAVTSTSNGRDAFDVVPLLRARIANPSGDIDLASFWPLTGADLSGPASHDDVLRRVWPQTPRFDEGDDLTLPEESRLRLEHGFVSSADWESMLAQLFNPFARDPRTMNDLMVLANHGVLDPELLVRPALDRLHAGDLPLPRLVEVLQFMFERGGLRAFWPLGLAVAAAAGAKRPKPYGLATLLGCLARYAAEVPTPARRVPNELVALAQEQGSTKSHTAARDLIAVLSSGAGVAA